MGCTTWMLIKRIEKKLDGICTRVLRAILNKSWKQHPSNCTATYNPSRRQSKLHKQDMLEQQGRTTFSYGALRTDEQVLGRPARTYQQQFYTDTDVV